MKFVCHKENFCNFVFGEHSDYCLYYFVIEHYKGTTIFANHQIYRQLYFIELTLIYINLQHEYTHIKNKPNKGLYKKFGFLNSS